MKTERRGRMRTRARKRCALHYEFEGHLCICLLRRCTRMYRMVWTEQVWRVRKTRSRARRVSDMSSTSSLRLVVSPHLFRFACAYQVVRIKL
jgi:hypothetical protein